MTLCKLLSFEVSECTLNLAYLKSSTRVRSVALLGLLYMRSVIANSTPDISPKYLQECNLQLTRYKTQSLSLWHSFQHHSQTYDTLTSQTGNRSFQIDHYQKTQSVQIKSHDGALSYPLQGLNNHSYTPRTLRACCSQSKFRILKIRESSARALFLYNCTPNISRSADASVSVA